MGLEENKTFMVSIHLRLILNTIDDMVGDNHGANVAESHRLSMLIDGITLVPTSRANFLGYSKPNILVWGV